MSAFWTAAIVIDTAGELVASFATTIIVILVYRKMLWDRRHQRRMARPDVIAWRETQESGFLLKFKNLGGSPAIDAHALVGGDEHTGGDAAFVDIGLMEPYAERVHFVPPSTSGHPVSVSVYYRDGDGATHQEEYVIRPHTLMRANDLPPEERREIFWNEP